MAPTGDALYRALYVAIDVHRQFECGRHAQGNTAYPATGRVAITPNFMAQEFANVTRQFGGAHGLVANFLYRCSLVQFSRGILRASPHHSSHALDSEAVQAPILNAYGCYLLQGGWTIPVALMAKTRQAGSCGVAVRRHRLVMKLMANCVFALIGAGHLCSYHNDR